MDAYVCFGVENNLLSTSPRIAALSNIYPFMPLTFSHNLPYFPFPPPPPSPPSCHVVTFMSFPIFHFPLSSLQSRNNPPIPSTRYLPVSILSYPYSPPIPSHPLPLISPHPLPPFTPYRLPQHCHRKKIMITSMQLLLFLFHIDSLTHAQIVHTLTHHPSSLITTLQ